MPKRKRRDTLTLITITLSSVDLVRWHALAKKEGVSFVDLAKRAVDAAIKRGSTS